MSTIIFEVLGKPEPADFRVGKGVFEKASVSSYKREVRRCAADAMQGRPPLAGPLRLTICFVRPIAKSHLRANGEIKAPTVKDPSPWAWTSHPDWDNMCKSAQDACSKVVWNDDKQVVVAQAVKVLSDHWRLIVHVEEVEQVDVEGAYSKMVGLLRRSRGVPEEGRREEVEQEGVR